MKAIYIICLIVLANATQGIDYFHMLATKDYGKTVIQALQLELQQGSADQVVGTLRGLLKDSENELGAIKGNLKNRQAQCLVHQSDAKSVIERANYKAAEDLTKLPLKKEESDAKNKQVEDKQGEEQRNNDKIVVISNSRKAQRALFEERRDELVGLVATLNEAKAIIEGKKSSFLQKNIQSVLDNFAESYPNQRGLVLMAQILMKSANKQLEQGAIEKLVGIIGSLVESIYDVQKEELLVDDQREQDFQNQKAQLENANVYLAAASATLHAQSLTLQQQILELSNDIKSNQQLSAVKTKELQDWNKTCYDEEKGLRSIYDGKYLSIKKQIKSWRNSSTQ
ncbi:hypothetical protein pb186bvf_004831 [Paramecium bursaria]